MWAMSDGSSRIAFVLFKASNNFEYTLNSVAECGHSKY